MPTTPRRLDAEERRARLASGQLRVVDKVDGDLGAGVATTDHDHAVGGEVLRALVFDRVQLSAAEGGAAGDGWEEGASPGVRRADHGPGMPDARVRFHAQKAAVPGLAQRPHTGRSTGSS
jgi:hypothetical protein